MTIKNLKRVNVDHQPGMTAVQTFLDSALKHRDAGAADGRAVFDAVSAETEVTVPAHLAAIFDKTPDKLHGNVVQTVMDAVDEYAARHGEAPSVDVVAAALQVGHSAFDPRKIDGTILDTATSDAHNQISLQANRAILGIFRTIAEAVPFAGMLPIDIGSNEAKLFIAETSAGSTFGDYQEGGSFEGGSLGGNYAVSARYLTLTANGGAGPYASQFRVGNNVNGSGEPDAATAALPILRGRTNLYVNGIPAGGEVRQARGPSSTNQIVGNCVLAGTAYSFTGTVTPLTGVISVTPSAALPAGTVVTAEAYIDFDTSPGLIPLIDASVTPYSVFANESRVMTSNAFSAASQMRNEAGIDPETLTVQKFGDQIRQERHYNFLRLARIQGAANIFDTFNFNFPNRGTQLVYSDIIRDMAASLGRLDQKVANANKDAGLTYCYTGERFAAILEGCPDYIWKSSGITKRPGIYFLGTLFSKYKVYYNPRAVEAADGSTSELVCIGVSDQPARNGFLMGEAVPATMLPLATNADLRRQVAMYVRDFAVINPHVESARRCARLSITGLNPA